MLMWTKARVKGRLRVLPGLVTRREAERLLFLKVSVLAVVAVEADEPKVAGDMPQAVEAEELKPPAKSKETWLGSIQAALAGAGAAITVATGLDWKVQLGVLGVTGLCVFGDRIWARLEGVR